MFRGVQLGLLTPEHVDVGLEHTRGRGVRGGCAAPGRGERGGGRRPLGSCYRGLEVYLCVCLL